MTASNSEERWIYAVLIAYAIGFLLFPPRALLIVDESNYVTQALAFARGALTVPGAAPLYPETPLRVASNYPPGTSLLQAPFVWIAGWQGAAALSVAALIVATVVTMKWLRDLGLRGGFALLVPAYAGMLLFSRVAMSDAPSAAIVVVSLWAICRADRGWRWAFGAGLASGASLLFRETNTVLLAPFFIGAIARRSSSAPAMLLGAALGIGVRLGMAQLLFGSPLYVRDSGVDFSIAAAARNLPMYAGILLVMFPAGAILPAFYRGPRRPEAIAAFFLYAALFVFYDYTAVAESGALKGMMLASRYFIPALPVLALMAADVYPRWLKSRIKNEDRAIIRAAFSILASSLVLLAFSIHPAMRRPENDALSIVSVIQRHTTPATPVITNAQVTLKYLSPVYGERHLIMRSDVSVSDIVRFGDKFGRLSVVLLDRDDGRAFREDASENALFLTQIGEHCTLSTVHDARHGSGVRLRVLSMDECEKARTSTVQDASP